MMNTLDYARRFTVNSLVLAGFMGLGKGMGIAIGIVGLTALAGCPGKDDGGSPDGGQVGPTPTCTDRADPANFVVDVPAIALTGKITVNGKVPMAQGGQVSLVNRDTGDSLYLGRTGDASYAMKLLVPGTYDVVYTLPNTNDASDIPRNQMARLRTGVDLKQTGALDIDIPAVALTGKITVNGATPMSNGGTVALRDPRTSDSVYLGRTGDAAYPTRLVIPGTYDVVYAYSSAAAGVIDVPRNGGARLRRGVEVKQSGALDVDIPAVTLAGKLTVNKQVPTSRSATVSLRDLESGDALLLGTLGDATYATKLVIPGTYDVFYSYGGQGTGTIDVPRNTNARLRGGVDVKQNGALDVDIPAVSLTGKITVNGATPMSQEGTITLREPNSSKGDSLYLGRTGDASYAMKLVIPGTYDAFYSYSNQGTGTIDIPRNTGARVRTGVEVKQSGALDINIPAVSLAGKITVNGAVPTSQEGLVSLREPGAARGDGALLGRTGDASYAMKLIIPGTYDAFYSYSNQGTGTIDIPRNAAARVRTGVEVKQNGALDIDVPALSVTGKITVNGKTPTSRSGQVVLNNPAIGDSVFLGRTGDATFSPRLVVPAPYNVVYGWSNTEPNPDVPRNTVAYLGCRALTAM